MLSLASALAMLVEAGAPDPRLPPPDAVAPSSRPAWRPGFFPLGLGRSRRDGVLRLPRSLPRDRPVPLLIMLHGAEGEARSAVTLLRPHAEARGFAVLAPESRGSHWVPNGAGEPQPDVDFVQAALRRLYNSLEIDPRRVAIAGFSNGATFGLALTLANGDWVSAGLVFSAGGAARVVRRGRPRLAVVHGRLDPGPPFERARDEIARPLREAGYPVSWQPFDGGHHMPPGQIRRALDVWLA